MSVVTRRAKGEDDDPDEVVRCFRLAETNLMARFPVFVVCKWIGNNPRTALKHYMQVTQKNIDDACGKPAEVSTQPLHPVNQLSEL